MTKKSPTTAPAPSTCNPNAFDHHLTGREGAGIDDLVGVPLQILIRSVQWGARKGH